MAVAPPVVIAPSYGFGFPMFSPFGFGFGMPMMGGFFNFMITIFVLNFMFNVVTSALRAQEDKDEEW